MVSDARAFFALWLSFGSFFGNVLWEPWWEKGRDLFLGVGHPADSSRDKAALGMTELDRRKSKSPTLTAKDAVKDGQPSKSRHKVSRLRSAGPNFARDDRENRVKIPTLNFAKNAKFRMGHPISMNPISMGHAVSRTGYEEAGG